MFQFGERKIHRQGGSCLLTLPIQWVKDVGIDIKKITVRMDEKKNLIIAPVQPSQAETDASQRQPA